MWQDAQKPGQKFCARKTAKMEKTHPKSSEKGETGCVLGAGEGCSRCGRVKKPGIRTKVNPKTILHMKKENRQKRSVSAGFWQGQKDLSRLPPRSVRGRAPLALAHPSARGFGVDVGERTREREKADVIRFPPQVPERAVLVWCCELFLEKDCVSTTTSSFERKAPPPGGWPS